MKNVLCIVGIHDWEILETQSGNTIRENYNEKNKCVVEKAIEYEYSTEFDNKICMKCNKINNEIKDHEFLLFQTDRRRKVAIEKYENTED